MVYLGIIKLLETLKLQKNNNGLKIYILKKGSPAIKTSDYLKRITTGNKISNVMVL